MKQNIANGIAMSRILGLSKPKEEADYDKAEELYKKRLARLRQMEGDVQVKADLFIPAQVITSFVPYITSVGKQCLQPMAYSIKLMTLLFFVSCLFNSAALGQSHQEGGADAGVVQIKSLQIGDTIPEALWHLPLQVVNHPDGKNTITLNEYRDKKLIILDFWGTWCAPCIQSLDSLNIFQTDYKNQLQVIPLTAESNQKTKQTIFRHGWNLFSSYDHKLKNYFPHRIVPHQVWIKNGVVLSITSHQYGKRDYISDVLNDQPVNLYSKIDAAPVQEEIDLLLSDTTILFQSQFKTYEIGGTTSFSVRENLILCRNMSVGQLFKNAYLHDLNPTVKDPVIWEVADELSNRLDKVKIKKDGVYEHERIYNNWARNFYYSYSLKAVGLSKNQLYDVFRTDLNSFFSRLYGIHATVENRNETAIVLSTNQSAYKKVTRDNESMNAFQVIAAIQKNFPLIPISIKEQQFYKMEFRKVDLSSEKIDVLKDKLSGIGVHLMYEESTIPYLIIKGV